MIVQIPLFDAAGNPLTGAVGSVSFVRYVRADGVVPALPTIEEVGDGMYQFQILDSDYAIGVAYMVQCAIASPVYTFGSKAAGNFQAIGVFDDASNPLATAAPSFALYRSATLIDRPQPSLVNLGGGLFGFTPETPDVAIAYVIVTGAAPSSYAGTIDAGGTSSTPRPAALAAVLTDPNAPGALTPRDFKIDPITRELVTANGDLVLVYGIEAIAQDCHLALGFFLGEWFADESTGFPWRQQVFVKSPSLDQIRAAVRTCLLGRKGVTAVDSVVLELDRSSRRLSINWAARCNLGLITGTLQNTLPVNNL